MAVPQATREKSCPALCSSAHPSPEFRQLWCNTMEDVPTKMPQAFSTSSLWKDFSTSENASSLQGRPLLQLCWDQTQIFKVLIQRLGCSAQVQNATTNFANVTAN